MNAAAGFFAYHSSETDAAMPRGAGWYVGRLSHPGADRLARPDDAGPFASEAEADEEIAASEIDAIADATHAGVAGSWEEARA